MAKTSDILDKISGNFFLAGLLLSKLKILPFRFLQPTIHVLSMSAYLLGYSTWYLATLFYPEHTRKRKSWYGFAQFKEQYQLTAFFGLLATLSCLINPSLICIPLCLFAISNLLWSISEYHKYHNPPVTSSSYSSAQQAVYLKYVLLTTSVSLIAAAASALALLNPGSAATLLLLSTLACNGLAVVAFCYWLKSTFGTFTPDSRSPIIHSYQKMSQALPQTVPSQNNQTPSPDRQLHSSASSLWGKPERSREQEDESLIQQNEYSVQLSSAMRC